MSVYSIFIKFENNHVFTESESWMLFKIAAIAEACGWTLLIIGIAIEKYIIPGNNIPVLLAGRTHGLLFILYALAAICLYPTLRWSRKRSLVALLASIPPYGSLLFEQWASFKRSNDEFKLFSNYILVLFIYQEFAV